MRLVLATQEEITYKYDNGIGNIVAVYESVDEASADAQKITPQALRAVEIYNDDDELVGRYENLINEGVELLMPDEGYAASFHFRELTTEEKQVGEVQALNVYRLVAGKQDVTIAANGVATVAIPVEVPVGYVFAGYREISIQDAAKGGKNKGNVDVRWFGSAEGGSKANVALRNIGAEEAVVQVSVTCLFLKG